MGREQQSVGGRLDNHNAVPRCRTDDCAFRFAVPMHPSRCSSTCTRQYNQDLSLATLVCINGNSLCNILIAFSALIGSGNFVILVLDVIGLPLCTAHTSASPESIQWYIFQSVVLRSCVTASPPGEEYILVEITIESPWSELLC